MLNFYPRFLQCDIANQPSAFRILSLILPLGWRSSHHAMSTTKIANSERQFAQAIHCQSFVKLPHSQQVVLQVKDASMHFGQRLLWQDVNFRFYRVNCGIASAPTVQARRHCEVYSNLCHYPVVQSRLAKIFEVGYIASAQRLCAKNWFWVGTGAAKGWMGKIICLVCLAPKRQAVLADSKTKKFSG